MKCGLHTLMTALALWELLAYDIRDKLAGFQCNYRALTLLKGGACGNSAMAEERIAEAMALATSLYWKRVRCLQRAVVTARLYRGYGMPAHVVIGCRVFPLLTHAWVEVAGRIVNDSPVYQKQMRVLDRIPC